MAADREMIEVRTGWAASLGSPPGQISLSRSRPVTASGSLLPQSGRTSAWRAASSPHVPRGRNAHYPDRQRVHPPAACRGREDPWSDRRRPLFKHDSEPLGPFRLAADQRGGARSRHLATLLSQVPISPGRARPDRSLGTAMVHADIDAAGTSLAGALPAGFRRLEGMCVASTRPCVSRSVWSSLAVCGSWPAPHSARVGVSLPPSPDISGRIRASSPGIELVADGGFLAH